MECKFRKATEIDVIDGFSLGEEIPICPYCDQNRGHAEMQDDDHTMVCECGRAYVVC